MMVWISSKKKIAVQNVREVYTNMADGYLAPLFPRMLELKVFMKDQPEFVRKTFDKLEAAVVLAYSGVQEDEENAEVRSEEAALLANAEIERLTKLVEQLQAPPAQPREVHRLNDPNVRQDVWRLTGGKCAYCDVPVQDGGTEPTSMCVEHVVPKSMGGPDHLTNYVPACRSCNNSKSDRHVLTLVRKLQRRTDVIVEAAE